MTDETQQTSSQWISDLVEGRGPAVDEFLSAYGPALQKIAANRMTPGLQQRVGADDVFQSVCRTFFRRAQEGRFSIPDRESLWRLLCAITLNKVRMQARFFSAQRREALNTSSIDNDIAEDTRATVEDAVEFADEFQQLMESLGETEAELVRLKLEGFSHAEIAEKLNCTERTVGRLLVKSRAALSDML